MVNRGEGCARQNSVGIYARITYYMDWIKHHAASGACKRMKRVRRKPRQRGRRERNQQKKLKRNQETMFPYNQRNGNFYQFLPPLGFPYLPSLILVGKEIGQVKEIPMVKPVGSFLTKY